MTLPSERSLPAGQVRSTVLASTLAGAALLSLLTCCHAKKNDKPTGPGPDAAGTGSSKTTSVDGAVLSQTGAPIPDATVAVFDPTQALFGATPTRVLKTDAAGRFRLDLPARHAWALTATSSSAPPAYAFLDEGSSAIISLKLAAPAGPSRHVSGQVKTNDGRPAPGAMVRLYPGDRKEFEVYAFTAGSDGTFSGTIGSADYIVIADAPGATFSVERLGPGAQDAKVELRLRPPPAPMPADAEQELRAVAEPLPLPDKKNLKLRERLCAARIVGVGEATHGSAEFTEVRSALLFDLARCGFGVLLVEADTSAVDELDQYVTSGKGDPKRSLQSTGKWPWSHDAALRLMERIKVYNQASPSKIRLVGIDPFFPNRAAAGLLEYIEKVDKPLRDQLAIDLEPLASGASWKTYTGVDAAKKARALGAIQRIREFVVAHQDACPEPEWLRMMLLLQALEASEARFHDPYTSVVEERRDQTMSRLSLWAINEYVPKAKALLAAHNGHVLLAQPVWKTSALGDLLRAALGPSYLVVGLLFGEGSFMAIDGSPSGSGKLSKFEVGPSTPGSLESLLHRLGMPLVIVDLASPTFSEPLRAWLASELPHRELGTRYVSAQALEETLAPALTYDLVAYVDTISAFQPLK